MGCVPHAMPIQHLTPKRIRRFTPCRSRTSRQGVAICCVPRSQGRRNSADAYVGPHSGRFACPWIIERDPAHYVDRATGQMIPGAVFCVGLEL